MAPIERLFAFVALTNIMNRLPIRAHGETAGSKTIDCLDQSRKIIDRHKTSSAVRLSISQACGKTNNANHFVVGVGDLSHR
ncbi:hypothetical protein [Rhizobium phaseoli]|uniref:hypothetical protein n=1 Tax=Rhizobium phaseoli TaxID=396 RepID=UPI0007E9294D|nr:hypothetical protein [Rhizobium phaseoli]